MRMIGFKMDLDLELASSIRYNISTSLTNLAALFCIGFSEGGLVSISSFASLANNVIQT